MLKYVQKKSINYKEFERILEDSSVSNQFTNRGPAKAMLEKELKGILNIDNNKSVLCVANGTLALHAIYLFLMRRNNNIKIVSPSFTFPSCDVMFDSIYIEDICKETYTLRLDKEIIKKYDVFVITNLFGTYPRNIGDWIRVCSENKKVLVFDNASSPMSTFGGNNICNLGDFSFGSLHHTKYMGFGEGGFLVLPKEHRVEMEELLGFGFKDGVADRKHNMLSSNFKMSDVAAAGILQHLHSYDFERHLALQNYFIEKLTTFGEKAKPFNFSDGVFYGNMPVIYKNPISVDHFRRSGIESQKYYNPIRDHEESLLLFERIMNFPLNSSMRSSDIDKIIGAIEETCCE